MPDVSLLEFGVVAFVAFSSLLMLIISIIKEIPMTRSMSISRSIYILMGVICMFVLSGMGLQFNGMTETTITNSTVTNNTGALITTEITNSTTTQNIKIVNYPLWVWLCYMFALIMAFFFIMQVVTLLTKTD